MSLRELLAVFRKRWLIVLVVTLVGVLLAAAHAATTPRAFQATAETFVSTSTEEQTGSIYQGSQFTLQRVASYTSVATSAQVLEPVITQLHLKTSVGALQSRVTATAPANTVLVDISATAPTAAEAADLANAVAAQFGQTVAELERPTAGAASPVKVTVIAPATAPRTPAAPHGSVELVLGLLVGLFVGTGLAVAREQTDTSVRTVKDVQRLAGTSPLGLVAVRRDPDDRLVALDRSDPQSEPYRAIRTNLQFVDVDRPPRSLVVTSAVPSEGKSTTAANLAIALAQAGRAVVLVDADLRRPAIAPYLGLEGSVGLSDVLAGRLALDEALQPWEGLLTVLTAGTLPPDPSEVLGSQQMRGLLERLSQRFDCVVLDSPPLLPVTDAAVLATVADGAIVVVRHGRTRRQQLDAALDSITSAHGRVLGTVLTFVPRRSAPGAYGYATEVTGRPGRSRGRGTGAPRRGATSTLGAAQPEARAPERTSI